MYHSYLTIRLLSVAHTLVQRSKNACTALQTRLCSVPKRLFSVARPLVQRLQTRLYSVTNRLFSVAGACTAPPHLQPILACTCMSPPRHRVTTGIPCPHVDSLALHCIFSNEQCWQHRNILLPQRNKLPGLPGTRILERHSLRKLVCMCVCVFALLPCIPLPLRPRPSVRRNLPEPPLSP